MRIITLLLFVFVGATSQAATSSRPPFFVQFRGGFMLEANDDALLRKWEHKPLESYQLALGGFYTFPPTWKEIFFFAGPEFYYQAQREELPRTYMDIEVFQFMATGGVAYQPEWLGGDVGASLAAALQIYGSKSAYLDTPGFTQDLGTEKVPWQFNTILAFYYDFGVLRPQISYETNSTISLGLNYAF